MVRSPISMVLAEQHQFRQHRSLDDGNAPGVIRIPPYAAPQLRQDHRAKDNVEIERGDREFPSSRRRTLASIAFTLVWVATMISCRVMPMHLIADLFVVVVVVVSQAACPGRARPSSSYAI